MKNTKRPAASSALHPFVWRPQFPKFGSYVDEAGHSKDPRRTHFCLAGLIAQENDWNKFDREWRTVCAEEGISLPFHMRDFAGFREQFAAWTEAKRREALQKLIQAIRNANAIPIGSVVSVTDFNAFRPQTQENLKDPYFVAFQSLTYQMAVAASMAEPMPGPATMMYAHHPEHSSGLWNAGKLWHAIRRYNPIIANFMSSYDCAEQIDHTPLQAADLWSYELGHHFEVIRPAHMKARWPFRQFVQMGLNYKFTHDFISYFDASGENGLGRMSRVTRMAEISLYSPGFVDEGATVMKRMLRLLTKT